MTISFGNLLYKVDREKQREKIFVYIFLLRFLKTKEIDIKKINYFKHFFVLDTAMSDIRRTHCSPTPPLSRS